MEVLALLHNDHCWRPLTSRRLYWNDSLTGIMVCSNSIGRLVLNHAWIAMAVDFGSVRKMPN